jgi:hypothetical protein
LSLYLDASAILPMFVTEPSSPAVEEFLARADDDLIVSEFAAAEVASGLSRLSRMLGLGVTIASAHLADFDAWRAAMTLDLDLVAADVRLANAFVRRFELGLRTPDAVHAAVCVRGGHTLVTLDRRLAAAAQALGVATTIPE